MDTCAPMGPVKGLLLGLLLNAVLPAHGRTEAADPVEHKSIQFEVVAESDALVVETTWLGEERSLELTEGPTGVWTGEWTGEEVRFLPISIEEVSRDHTALRYAGLEVIPSGTHTLRYRQVSANRIARAPAPSLPLHKPSRVRVFCLRIRTPSFG